MISSKAGCIIFTLMVISCGLIELNEAMPSIGNSNLYTKRFETGFDFIPICLNNCAQCKRELGDYFQAQTCAESCLKFNGKVIPNCDDRNSIAPFLNVLQ